MSRMYSYKVTSSCHRSFPIDMLRYDAAWPGSSEDVEAIHTLLGNYKEEHKREILAQAGKLSTGNVEIYLNSREKPTTRRWESFGWVVSQVISHNVA